MAKNDYQPKHAASKKEKKQPKEEPKQKEEKPEKAEKQKREVRKSTKVLMVVMTALVLISCFYLYSAKVLKQKALEVKLNASAAVQYVRDGDIDGAKKSWNSAETASKAAYKTLTNPAWRIAGAIPYFGTDIKSARTLLEVFNDASESLVKPGFDLLREYPISALKLEDGFNANLCVAYLDFLLDNTEEIDSYAEKLQGLKFRFIKLGNGETISKLTDAVILLKDNENLLKLMKQLFGDGEDRFYIIPAQNMAEIRASGGFPGSIGSMEIKDGVLKIGKFRPINDVIYYAPMPATAPTKDEYRIFSGNLQYARDACYLPDFERCAEIWADSYEYKTNTLKVDGAISFTPTIIQDILSVTGETLTLSDGTEINGQNATKVIQRDIYFNYFKKGAYGTATANEITDELFAETAEKSLETATSKFSISYALEYLRILNQGFKDRTIMMWFDDAETEQLCKDVGCSGIIDTGAYFSCYIPSKLGWFFEMTTDVKDKGNSKYEVTLTLKNTMTNDEVKEVSTYVSGYTYGGINGYLHLVAPENGKISDIRVSNGIKMNEDTYHNHDIYYTFGISLGFDESLTVTYTITSEEPFELATTPTLTKYK